MPPSLNVPFLTAGMLTTVSRDQYLLFKIKLMVFRVSACRCGVNIRFYYFPSRCQNFRVTLKNRTCNAWKTVTIQILSVVFSMSSQYGKHCKCFVRTISAAVLVVVADQII